jgi:predicted ATPase/DNA-binding SARP family transcriptional activator
VPDGAAVAVRIDLLGPLRLTVDGRAVDVRGPRRRAVLALLAMASPRAVSTGELVDALWPSEPPESGARALHSHISRLRGHLGPAGDRLVRDGSAYRLALGPGDLDVADLRAGADGAGPGGTDRTAGLGPERIDALGRTLALWRGAALDEFADVEPLAADAVALAELRRDLTDEWLALRVDRARAGGGAPADLVADATRAATAEPARERTHALLVRALTLAGRQADALRAAHEFRRRLAEDTGLDPGPDLTAAEQDAARGAPAPAPTPAPAARPRPRPASPLVGREHDLAALRLRVGGERLVTVIGPGGVGKTRLALEVAADAAEEGRPVHVVELAEVEDEDRVTVAVGTALGLRVGSHDAVLDAARDALTGGRPLLLLDNCEHVVDAARTLIGRLVDASPDLTVLATSRRPLGLAAEHVVRLGPLPVPEEGRTDVADVPAVRAFLAHARRRQPGWEPAPAEAAVVGDVVRRLDGLPLALELAAGRVGTLSLGDLAARLDRALDLLEAGRPAADARHRTLRDTIDWSYRALAPGEQRLLGALAVFPGGVDLATAERLADRRGVSGDPAATVAHLVDMSMLTAAGEGGTTRYRALETVRAYMLDQLAAAGERNVADADLVAWAEDLASEAARLVVGPDEAVADRLVRAEAANLQAAWAAAGRRGDLDARVAIVVHLDGFTTWRDVPFVSAWALELADDPGLDGHPRRPEVWGAASHSAWRRGDLDRADRLARAAIAESPTPEQAVYAEHALAAVELFRGNTSGATTLWLHAAAASPDGQVPGLLASAALGPIYEGDSARARELIDRSFAAAGTHGAPSDLGFAHYAAAELAAATDPDAAAEQYRQAIGLAQAAGGTFVEGVAAVGLVRLLGASGRTAEALAGYRRLIDGWRRAGHWTQMWTTLRNLAAILGEVGQAETAALVLGAADAAPEAPTVTVDAVVADLAALGDRLAGDLGDAAYAAARARGAALPRGRVVDAALAAIDEVSPEGRSPTGR